MWEQCIDSVRAVCGPLPRSPPLLESSAISVWLSTSLRPHKSLIDFSTLWVFFFEGSLSQGQFDPVKSTGAGRGARGVSKPLASSVKHPMESQKSKEVTSLANTATL